jgi:hypothetical protein
MVVDCGFTGRAAVAALLDAKLPFILGFARSRPIRARLAALSGQQRRWLRDAGAIRLGACAWDARLRLFAIGTRSPADKRSPWAYGISLRSWGPNRLATTYRRRCHLEQAIEEFLNGIDLDHLVGHRLLARNLAIGLQIRDAMERPAGPRLHGRAADARPAVIREPAAFRASHVDGLGTFHQDPRHQ